MNAVASNDERAVRVQLLGEVRAWRGDQELDPGKPQQRFVLAALARNLGTGLAAEELAERIWGPPADHETEKKRKGVIQTHISVLRDQLDPDVGSRGRFAVLARHGERYHLRLDRCQVDYADFADRVREARRLRADGALAAAISCLETALALWHGRALGRVSGFMAEAWREAMSRERLAAVIELAAMKVAAGWHAEVAEELARLVTEHPQDEGLMAQHMVVLYRCGLQSEALDAYRQIVDRLRNDGLDPAPSLSRLHEKILNHQLDPSPKAVARNAGRVPWELPADAEFFVGRSDELAGLNRLVDAVPAEQPAAGRGPGVAVLSSASGIPEIGTTALAVHWAYQAKAGFPDGAVHVTLRGYDPGQAVLPAEALSRLLRSLGIADRQIPREPGERASLYQEVMRHRRMLVLLDDAATAEQAEPLLPAGTSAADEMVVAMGTSKARAETPTLGEPMPQ